MSQSDFVTRGQALVSSGQYQEAVKVCRLGLLGRPTTVEGRVVLGQALLALKRYDEVLAEMRVALELDHASQPAQVLKAEALIRKGDGPGAVEVLGKLRAQGVSDPHVAGLLAEAERLAGRSPPPHASHPAVGFLAQDAGAFSAEQGTKNYPAHQADAGGPDPDGQEDTGGEYTRPTSIAAPSTRKRPDARLPPDATPSPAVLAVGDRSGTVEVDPELDSLEVRPGDDDFGDVVAPPVARHRPDPDGGLHEGARGSVKASTRSPMSPAAAVPAAGKKSRRASMFKEEVSTVELGDDEVIELEDTRAAEPRSVSRRVPGPGTAVRNAVKMPSGPLDQPQPAATRPTALPQPAQSPPPHLAQMIASQPHVMNVAPLPPQPQINPRSAIAAALPTAAALPMQPQMSMPPHGLAPQMGMPQGLAPQMGMPQGMPPQMGMPQGMAPQMQMGMPPQMSVTQQGMPPPLQQPAPHLQQTLLAMPQQPPQGQQPPHLQSSLAAARPTIALNPQQQQSADAVDAMFNGQGQAPVWARAKMMAPAGPGPYPPGKAAADEPTRQPHEIDPKLAAMLAGQGGIPAAFPAEQGSSPSRPVRAGRKARSRLQILVWILIGALVIGGGVFAGFQIRAMRLRRQIAAAREHAVDIAKADTWQGWLGARDSLYSIAQASPTVDNRAALARARGVLAFEFGDGVADARAAVEGLAGQTGTDLELARAYLALAQSDAKASREAADRAVQASPGDAAALYVSGQAAMLAGDLKSAIAALRSAIEREARPLYTIGLARALGAAGAWDDATAALDRVRDNPGATIARGVVVSASGRLAGGPANELRAQLAKIIADGQKPGDQDRVSPAQVAFADLALARVDFARNELGAAHADYLASLNVNLDDQRFAEELGDTVYAIGELEVARKVATRTLDKWPTSRRARTTLAQVWLALGKPAAAVELFTKAPELAMWPAGQTLRGQARLASGDVDGARADFDAAIKKLPGFEPAVIARSWFDLATGDLDAARKRIEPKFNAKSASTAMVAVYAAILRQGGDPAERDKAKAMLERVVGGAPSLDTARAQLELARIERDLGDLHGARAAYAEASRTGNVDARLESALVLIDDGDPRGGHETLEQLLKDAGDHPSAPLVLEAARARSLAGDHRGAADLLAQAAKLPGVVPWQLDRERGRLALRRGDTAGAAQALERALATCGGDLDTFLLAADTISTDEKLAALAQTLKTLLPTRLKGRPELDIIHGKLELAAGKQDEAEKAYNTARDALAKENASPRRRAQADYGLAAIAYFRRDDPSAQNSLQLVVVEDPSIYAAYLFGAEILRPRDARKALELAQQATALNPDSLDGWKLVGTLAAQLANRKLLGEAITRVGELAPGSDTLRQLQALR